MTPDDQPAFPYRRLMLDAPMPTFYDVPADSAIYPPWTHDGVEIDVLVLLEARRVAAWVRSCGMWLEPRPMRGWVQAYLRVMRPGWHLGLAPCAGVLQTDPDCEDADVAIVRSDREQTVQWSRVPVWLSAVWADDRVYARGDAALRCFVGAEAHEEER